MKRENSKKMDIPEGREEVQNNNCGYHHEEHAQLFDLDSLSLGYRFCPTDVELIYYLSMKVHHQPLPPIKIVEVNLYAHPPDHLAGRYKAQGVNEWFYFSPRERKYRNCRRPNRVIEGGDGYWKASAAEKKIIWEDDGRLIGYKRPLVFYKGAPPNGEKTDWLMQEYRVADHTDINNMKRFDDYVLCRVYKKNCRSGGGDSDDHDKGMMRRKRRWGDGTLNAVGLSNSSTFNIASSGMEYCAEKLMSINEGGIYNPPFVNHPHTLALQNQHQHPHPPIDNNNSNVMESCPLYDDLPAELDVIMDGRSWVGLLDDVVLHPAADSHTMAPQVSCAFPEKNKLEVNQEGLEAFLDEGFDIMATMMGSSSCKVRKLDHHHTPFQNVQDSYPMTTTTIINNQVQQEQQQPIYWDLPTDKQQPIYWDLPTDQQQLIYWDLPTDQQQPIYWDLPTDFYAADHLFDANGR